MPPVPANRAPVRPRVRVLPGGVARLFEEEIAELLARPEPALVWLVGPPGSGKSTALAHLAAVFAGEARLRLWDDEPFVPGADAVDVKAVTAATPMAQRQGVTVWTMAPWSDDDCLEYLRAVHPARVAPAFAAWRATTAEHDVLEFPELCREVLDRLAGEHAPADVFSALRGVCAGEDAAMARRLAMVAAWAYRRDAGRDFVREHQSKGGRWRVLLRSRTVIALLAADVLVESAVTGLPRPLQDIAWDRPLGIAVLAVVEQDADRAERLRALVGDEAGTDQALALSLLAVAYPGFRPASPRLSQLAHALLVYSDLSGKELHGDCNHVHLAHANLRAARLDGCRLRGAKLAGADLTDASLRGADAIGMAAPGLCAPRVDAGDANLVGAWLCGARLHGGRFAGAELSQARLDGVDLTRADLTRARLDGTDLRTTRLTGACLREAKLRHVQAGGVVWQQLEAPWSDWSHADLTGAQWPAAHLQRATLRHCGLAEVDWTGADLRGADFTGATFHLGNARSGLVDSTIASEGSRTGFYTDESREEHWQAPERVRKANLQHCDLRGAWLQGVDLYLVDLRGARLDPTDRVWARRCRALLDAEGAA